MLVSDGGKKKMYILQFVQTYFVKKKDKDNAWGKTELRACQLTQWTIFQKCIFCIGTQGKTTDQICIWKNEFRLNAHHSEWSMRLFIQIQSILKETPLKSATLVPLSADTFVCWHQFPAFLFFKCITKSSAFKSFFITSDQITPK